MHTHPVWTALKTAHYYYVMEENPGLLHLFVANPFAFSELLLKSDVNNKPVPLIPHDKYEGSTSKLHNVSSHKKMKLV